MKITEKKIGNCIVFSIEGRLDSTTSLDLEKKVDEAIQVGTYKIVLDFKNLEYISSAGIRVLIRAHKELEKFQGMIVFAAVSKNIENILYITGFLSYFKVFETLDAALSFLGNQ